MRKHSTVPLFRLLLIIELVTAGSYARGKYAATLAGFWVIAVSVEIFVRGNL